jgi:hypothetical protein
MLQRLTLTVLTFVILVGTAAAQQCLHEGAVASDQLAREREALWVMRLINTFQANSEAMQGIYLGHAQLGATLGAARNLAQRRPDLSLKPGDAVLPGWKLTLDTTEGGYWFMITDTTDPCGFSFISNQAGVILRATPIR